MPIGALHARAPADQQRRKPDADAGRQVDVLARQEHEQEDDHWREVGGEIAKGVAKAAHE
jgi:hypothetical protein